MERAKRYALNSKPGENGPLLTVWWRKPWAKTRDWAFIASLLLLKNFSGAPGLSFLISKK